MSLAINSYMTLKLVQRKTAASNGALYSGAKKMATEYRIHSAKGDAVSMAMAKK